MKKLIVYCHGYGSGANSTKLKALQYAGFNAHCFEADIDPVEAVTQLTKKIDDLLIDHLNHDIELVFVGTSLGGWMASNLAGMYGAKAVIINPSVNPSASLLKYGVPEVICNRYSLLVPSVNHKYFFAEKDEVIDNVEFREKLINDGFNVEIIPGADHRFQKHFGLVIDYLKEM
jgi:predicted esterase YcpF (UPF0227 family)